MTPPLLPTKLFGSAEQEPKRIKVVFPEGMIEGRKAELLAAQRNVQLTADSPKESNVKLQDVYSDTVGSAKNQTLPSSMLFADEKQDVVPAHANHKAYIAALAAAHEVTAQQPVEDLGASQEIDPAITQARQDVDDAFLTKNDVGLAG